MTEKAMKEMLADIINNNYQYEVKKHDKWVPYKLGEEINFDYDYRKVDYCYVYAMAIGKPYIISNSGLGNYIFKGTKEECENWVSKQTWFEIWQRKIEQNGMFFSFKLNAAQGSSLGIVNFARKLLEETKDYQLELIIKELGVPIE